MSEKKRALVTGITGQDGAYLARLLLQKGYEVHGVKRRTSVLNTDRIDDLYEDPFSESRHLYLHYGDMTDSTNLIRLMKETRPHEVYNLAAQSHVAVSFESPEYTANCDALGTLRLLEAIRILDLEKHTKLYQASTSELYGLVQEIPQKETTPFYPRSPYATAKLYAYWICKNYRESYGIFAVNGILFNHESSLRGETFVTRKITRHVAKLHVTGKPDVLYLGNLDSLRDWGHARDYVEAMYLMLQREDPKDYVIATNEQHSVREFTTLAYKEAGIEMGWKGTGLNEEGFNLATGEVLVKVSPKYFRPNEVDTLLGDCSQARKDLGWVPQVSFGQLVTEMVQKDIAARQSNRKFVL